ncbi:MAG TPA: hypothetical protein VIV06_06370 [Candidatus Limnocylindrales bacterium]
MVAIVLVAHSPELVRGLRAMLQQASPTVPVAVAAGTATGALGTSSPAVHEALRMALRASDDDGVIVLFDLGSAALAIEMAVEELSPHERSRVLLSSAPLVEGAVLAGLEAAAGRDLAAVAGAAEAALSSPKLPPE